MRFNNLPYNEKHELCRILDSNDLFFELGQRHMQFTEHALQSMLNQCQKSNTSPHDRLLTEWTFYDHTLFEIFILLKRTKQYNAMKVIKNFIDAKYYYLIKEEEPSSKKIMNGSFESNENNESSPVTPEIEDTIPLIPYEELQKATDNWSKSNELGKGGFGVVFKGVLRCTEVAIKRINKNDDSPESDAESYRELRFLNANRHDNVLSLYACSKGGSHHCLVYQFMPGGSLDKRLNPSDLSRVLSWPSRLNIARGTALGLQFLHTIRHRPLIHGDIKSANILLDANDSPRIGDFGLAREGPMGDFMKISRIQGTRPYLPADFIQSHQFSTKVDTYSFGVVLFELATGAPAYFSKRKQFLKDYVTKWEESKLEQLKDSKVPIGGDDVFHKLIEVGKKCVRSMAQNRPEMVEVYLMLKA